MWTINVYRDTIGEWRWKLKATNGKIIADSAEGYKRERSAANAANRLAKRMHAVKVVSGS